MIAGRRARNGYSLVELLVTLALAGLIAMVSLPYLSGSRSAIGFDADARMLAARLRLAREVALATRTAVAVTVLLVPPEVQGPGPEKSYRLRSVERLRATTAKGPVAGDAAVIVFSPDGSASGGTLILESGPRRRSIRVAWLTGVVSLEEAAP